MLHVWVALHARQLIVTAIVVALASFATYSFIKARNDRLERVSNIYDQVIILLTVNSSGGLNDAQEDKLEELMDQIVEEYPDTLYAQYTLLIKARLEVQQQRFTDALYTYEDLLTEYKVTDELRAFAELHKARVLIAIGRYEEVVDLVNSADSDFMSPAYLELRGDLLVLNRQWSSARQIYENAKSLYGETVPVPISLGVKHQFTTLETIKVQNAATESTP